MFEQLVLKLATHADATPIARMSAALIEYGLPQVWSVARILHHIRQRNSAVLVAKKAEQVMGFAVMEFGDESAHLNLFAVSTLARRCGIGRRLLDWLHESAMTAGTFSIDLELRAANDVAFKFYTAMGYRQSGYIRRYYSNAEDAIRMSRNLAVVHRSASAPLSS